MYLSIHTHAQMPSYTIRERHIHRMTSLYETDECKTLFYSSEFENVYVTLADLPLKCNKMQL